MTEALKKRNFVFVAATVIFLIAVISTESKTRRRNNHHPFVKSGFRPKNQRRSSFCVDTHPNLVLDHTATLRFHKETQQCYRVGERGPCGEMMVFTIEDRDFGVCDCDLSLRCGRPLVYWPSKNRCYHVHDQGPCREGKWLVFGFDLHPVCRRNPCLINENQNPSHNNRFWFSYKGKCYRTYTQGYCQNEEILFNEKNHFRPTCVKNPDCAVGPTSTGSVQSLTCLPGQRQDFFGKCQREFKPLGEPSPENNHTDLTIKVTPRPTNLYCLFCYV